MHNLETAAKPQTIAQSPLQLPPGWAVVAILLAVSILPYINSLEGSFHFDDEWAIEKNMSIRTWEGLSQRSPPRWLTYLSYHLNYRIHGLDYMPGWHIANILLHTLCVMTLYVTMRLLLAWRQNKATIAPLIAALLFAVHPLGSEPVNYIRAREVILYSIFTMAALCGGVIIHRGKTLLKKAMGGLLLIVAVALAAVTKDVAAFIALAAPVLYWAVFLGPKLVGRMWFWVVSVAAIVISAIGGWAWVYFSGTMEVARGVLFHPLSGHHFWAMTTVYWRYVSLAVLPLPSRLSVDHYVQYYPSRIYSFADGDVLAASAGILMLIAAVIFLARKRPVVSVFLGLMLVGILPYFFITTIDIFIEYKFYLPLAAFCALAGMCLAKLTQGRLRAAAPGIAFLCLLLATGTVFRNTVWRTDLSLWQDAAAKGPSKARTINVLAWVYATDAIPRNPQRALVLARRSFDDRYVDPWWGYDPHMVDTLAEAYYANGMYERAIEIEEDLIARKLGPVSYFSEQLAKFRRGQLATADRNAKSQPTSQK